MWHQVQNGLLSLLRISHSHRHVLGHLRQRRKLPCPLVMVGDVVPQVLDLVDAAIGEIDCALKNQRALNRLTDPPKGISREFVAERGVKFFNRAGEPLGAFLN